VTEWRGLAGQRLAGAAQGGGGVIGRGDLQGFGGRGRQHVGSERK